MTATIRELVALRLFEVLVDLGVERDNICCAASWEQLGADPLAVLRAVESHYGVQTHADEVARVHDVGEAVDYVVGRVVALSRERALSEAA